MGKIYDQVLPVLQLDGDCGGNFYCLCNGNILCEALGDGTGLTLFLFNAIP